MSSKATLGQMLPLIKEILSSDGEISFTPNGNSMYPMLVSGRDEITLKRPDRKIKKYDIPLYCRDNGQFVLHRIIGKNKDGYKLRGDNQLVTEKGVTEEQIVGIVVRFERDGKKIAVDDVSYKLYVFLRCNELTVLLRKLKFFLEKIFKYKHELSNRS